jgi:hypothetical protein
MKRNKNKNSLVFVFVPFHPRDPRSPLLPTLKRNLENNEA